MFFLWVLTVWKLEKRLATISFVVIPRAMSLRISVSVFVRWTFSSRCASLDMNIPAACWQMYLCPRMASVMHWRTSGNGESFSSMLDLGIDGIVCLTNSVLRSSLKKTNITCLNLCEKKTGNSYHAIVFIRNFAHDFITVVKYEG